MTQPTNLRVEHLDEAFAIGVLNPRLSWQLPGGAHEQVAYRVQAGEWDSGRVQSSQSVLVPYAGPTLSSGQRVVWRVKVWTDLDESDWSEPGFWEMGLLEPSDWVASWIEPVETDEVRAQTLHPAYVLRSSFTVAQPILCARLYATAHGIYEVFLNAERVGDFELTPGFTSYPTNLQVQRFDVTELLVPGENEVRAVLSDGWFRGQNAIVRRTHVYGESVALLAQLNLHGADGSLTRIGTGPEWVFSSGSIVGADLIEGEVDDLRRMSLEWSPVVVRDYELERLRWSPAPPVRRVEELAAVAVTQPRPDRQVVDLGQNINGWIRLTSLGPEGTTLTLTYGETLDAEGDVTQVNIDARDAGLPDAPNLKRPFQVDQVTADRNDQSFEPRHTTHGFRYVRIEGHPDEVTTDDVRGVVVHTDLRRIGWFECSEERINRLHKAAVWTFRGNACDIPTDCPTRERQGYGGDWQVFAEAAAFLYHIAGFATKWLRDVAADQRLDGYVPPFAPNTLAGHPLLDLIPEGIAAWGDAAVLVPWEIYGAYGDVRLLEEQWPSMSAWVKYAAQQARSSRHPSRDATCPVSAPHEVFLWDTGNHLGEWLEPGHPGWDPIAFSTADHGVFATAYLHHSASILAEIAQVIGRDGDAASNRELAAATKAAWQAEFLRPDGMLSHETQATYVRALAFELIPEELRAMTAQRLVELIHMADVHPGTGILTTGLLLPVLADNGYPDVAYQLLFQSTGPSWLRMVDAGATTIWEAWDGVDASGNARYSLNHYAFAAVITFLHAYIAGIRRIEGEPGYRRFLIAPLPGGGITWAHGALDSPYGRIESSWRIENDEFLIDLTVPPGTRAKVQFPGGRSVEVLPGRSSLRAQHFVIDKRKSEDCALNE